MALPVAASTPASIMPDEPASIMPDDQPAQRVDVLRRTLDASTLWVASTPIAYPRVLGTSKSRLPVRPLSNGPTIIVVLALAVASGIFFNDYYAPASEHLAGGLYATEQVLGLYAAFGLALASVATLLLWPKRLYVSDQGLLAVRGVPGLVQQLLPKGDMRRIECQARRAKRNGILSTSHVVAVVGRNHGSTEIRRFGTRTEALALAETCSQRWQVEVAD